jgi:flagellar FliJ protein
MANFIFRLQPVLNVKIQMEDSLKNELGKATQRLETEARLLQRLETARDMHTSQMNEKSEKGSNIKELRDYSSYIFYIDSQISIQKDNVNSARENVDKYREMLIKAVQEKEMLQKLRDRQLEIWQKEQLRLEQGITDEIVSYGHSSVPEED